MWDSWDMDGVIGVRSASHPLCFYFIHQAASSTLGRQKYHVHASNILGDIIWVFVRGGLWHPFQLKELMNIHIFIIIVTVGPSLT